MLFLLGKSYEMVVVVQDEPVLGSQVNQVHEDRAGYGFCEAASRKLAIGCVIFG